MEFYIAQGIGVITAIVAVFMMQLKNLKWILLCQLLANLLTAISYALLGGLSGAGISIIAIVQSIVMFFYNKKGRKPHLWVVGLFIISYVVCSIIYYKTFIDVFPAISAVCFAISISVTTPFMSRVCYSFNPIFWVIYDISTKAYGNFLIHASVFISTVVALIRVDGIFKRKNKKPLSKETFIENKIEE